MSSVDMAVNLRRSEVPLSVMSKQQTPFEVADLFVNYLNQMGVEYVFGVPGGAIEPLYNALARSARRGGVRPFVARHETGAAFMADGYARETGKIGVCCATSGPGATNLMTGVACAYENNIPMLVITAQPALANLGRFALQESSCTGVNVVEMFRYCTLYSSLVSHPRQFESKLSAALQRAMKLSRGPVHLSIPRDVFSSTSSTHQPCFDLSTLLEFPSVVDEDAVERLYGLLKKSKKVVILVGGGCGEAIASILQIATFKSIPIVTTADGKGLVSPQHPLYKGVFGFGGHKSAEVLIEDGSADMILAIGVSMGEWNSGGWSQALQNERFVHVDELQNHFIHTPSAGLHIYGRISSVLNGVLERIFKEVGQKDKQDYVQWLVAQQNRPVAEPEGLLLSVDKYKSVTAPIKPQRLMFELGRLFPAGTRFLADAGNSAFWATHYLHPKDRRRSERRMDVNRERKASLGRRCKDSGWLRLTTEFIPMGWAVGSAIGVAAANPGVPVVCITGDGSMLMNGNEISSAVAEGLNVIFVILNDAAYGTVKHGQRLGGAEPIAFQLPSTDFAVWARAMGAEAYTIYGPEDFDSIDIDRMCKRQGPTLLDVQIDPEEVPPISMRVRTLSSGAEH